MNDIKQTRWLSDPNEIETPEIREIIVKADLDAKHNAAIINRYFGVANRALNSDFIYRPYFKAKIEPSSGYEADGNTPCPGERLYAVWVWEIEPGLEHGQEDVLWRYSNHHCLNVFGISAQISTCIQKKGVEIWMQSGEVCVCGGNSEYRYNSQRLWNTNNGVVGEWTKNDIPVIARTVNLIEDARRIIQIEKQLNALHWSK